MDKAQNKHRTLFIYSALAIVTLFAFWRINYCEFIMYDDPAYVTSNPRVRNGLTFDNIKWAFSATHASNWHPLTWLSHMFDCHLFDTDPRAHHLTGLLLHITNSLLLFALLKKMTAVTWQSAFVAAAFAVHPLHVESVVWIAERKDLLSTLFWLLTIAAYLHYTKKPRLTSCLLTLLLFALGLMAKPMLVTLPLVLLLLDYWPLDRFRKNSKTVSLLIAEKIPFLLLSAISSTITFITQKSSGAVVQILPLPLKIRLANAALSYAKYILKMFYPANLALFYPHPVDKLPYSHAFASAILLLAITILVITLARKYRYLLTGWLWFIITLVPVIGLVQVGLQAMADRYTYIPLIGLFLIIAWLSPDLLAKYKFRKFALTASAIIVLLALSISTFHQTGFWRNSSTLFQHSLNATKDNYLAHTMIGLSLQQQHKLNQAADHYNKALDIRPDYAYAHTNLASILQTTGRLDEAVSHHRRALELMPNSPKMHNNLGLVLSKQKNYIQAIDHFNRALKLSPRDTEALNNLGIVFSETGQFELALTHFNMALLNDPKSIITHTNLANSLAMQSKFEQALVHFKIALDLALADKNRSLADSLRKKIELCKNRARTNSPGDQ